MNKAHPGANGDPNGIRALSRYHEEHPFVDNGAGLGASHQTGWTGLVAKLIQMFGAATASDVLADGRKALVAYQEE